MTGHKRVSIMITVQIKYDIRREEWTKKRYLEMPLIRLVYEIGLAVCSLPGIFLFQVSAVGYIYSTIITKLILGSNVIHTTFEAVIQPGDLVPLTQVALDIEIADRGNTIWQTRTSSEEKHRQ